MGHYKSNLRDIFFNLFEVLGRDEILGTGPYVDMDHDTAVAVLTEVDHLARTKLADSFAEVDRDLPVFDPSTYAVTLPEALKKTYSALMKSGSWQLELPAELGGQPTPPSVQWAVNELNVGANPAVYLYSTGPKFAFVLWANGTERDRKIAKFMVDRGWAATMVLTEPDAGSDVGAGRTRAIPQSDGSWHLEGVKRFITSAEHDLSENIVHLVLARPSEAAAAGTEGRARSLPDGVGGPGTKGLSLFIVPKWHFDFETGELTGVRNGVYATNVEHKMGIRGSTTCELTFGAGNTPAKGWLLGEVHAGIAQMFQVIEYARMMVGTKAIATLSTGYLNALEYAKTRVQGPDLTRAADKTAPRVPITHHPDVRRSLMTQQAFADGLPALVQYTSSIQDRVWLARLQELQDVAAERLNDLLLPIVKGYGSERSWVLLGTESLQTLGGSGFLTDYPIEQYVRDAKIDTLYEGTTAIQGQDLFFRKIIKDQGQALQNITAQITEFLGMEGGIGMEGGNGQLKEERELLQHGMADVGAIIETMAADFISCDSESVRNVYKVGLNTTRLLMCLGDVICAWLLLRGAEVALGKLNAELAESERHFYEGKVASARWFTHTALPKLAAERAIAESADLAIMDLAEEAF